MANPDFTLGTYKVPQFSNIYYEVKNSYQYTFSRKYPSKEINRQIIHNHLSNLAYEQFSIFKQVNPSFVLDMEDYFTSAVITHDFGYFLIAYSCFIMDICEEFNITDPWPIFDMLAPIVKNLLNTLYTIKKENTL